ncbi:hypothetical protein GH714_030462 [Hevea brasiliensis]|uniref:ABC transporter domain-containing protein n=1 Tax=Hevea brasiliensis TaxID=3981 RepID=A0A6A6N3H4_HEVBR|nr:hypothetical protein GH714_030462 [Hevea brasiliensis]
MVFNGVGKTTLMDVLAGRKTGGYIKGNITIFGYPKNYLIEELMELVGLTSLREALVGLLGVNGLSIEQHKRMTIAIELVANQTIFFTDEQASGLDARAAAIVMTYENSEEYFRHWPNCGAYNTLAKH